MYDPSSLSGHPILSVGYSAAAILVFFIAASVFMFDLFRCIHMDEGNFACFPGRNNPTNRMILIGYILISGMLLVASYKNIAAGLTRNSIKSPSYMK